MLVNQTFLYKNGSRRYKYLVMNGDRTFFTNEETLCGKKYDETLICKMIDFVIDNTYIKIGNNLFSAVAMYRYPHGYKLCPTLGNG